MLVRRLEVGRAVVLFDGAGREADAEIVSLAPEGGRARVLAPRPAATESPLAVCLVQALPVKLPRMDDIVRQCTELGVRAIVPVLAAHSQLPGGGLAALARRVARWRRLGEAAAKQSGRSEVPRIAEPVAWAELDWSSVPRPAILLDPAGSTGGLADVSGGRHLEATLIVGPEGGWSEGEIESALAHGAQPVSLGPRTLRTDTAGAAALAILQHRWGDLA